MKIVIDKQDRDLISFIVMDLILYLRGNNSNSAFATMQQLIGIKFVSRGQAMKNWLNVSKEQNHKMK